MLLPRPLAASAILPFLLGADTYPRQPGVDAQHYVFRLTLSDNTAEIAGEATIDIRFVKDGLSQVALDLASPAAGIGMRVSAVASHGAPLRFTHRADRLLIELGSPPDAGAIRQFTVRYHGIPKAGLRIGTNKYKERTF